MFKLVKHLSLGLLLGLACAASAFAAYPDRPITLIVPFGSGGSNDIPARVLASMMEKKLGQPIVVQNVVGAGGTQGSAQIAAARPDGYTLGYDPTGALCLQPHLLKLPYGKDSFDIIGMATSQPVVLMTGKNAPWKNVQEFVEMARKEPGKYVAGITAKGNMSHVPVLEFAKHMGIELRYVPYRATPEIMKDMAAGRIQLHADGPVALSQYDLFGLVQFSDAPVDNLPMPSAKDLKFDQTFMMWQMLIAPKGLPKDIHAQLVSTMKDVVTSDEFKTEITKLSINAKWMGPEEATAYFHKEFDAYGESLKDMFTKQ